MSPKLTFSLLVGTTALFTLSPGEVVGQTWQRATSAASWSYRSEHSSPVFDGKMWVIGGTEYGNDAGSHRNDVWISTNGANWTRVTANAPWSYRSGHGSVVFNGRMWVIGGTEYMNDAGSHRNDIWYSTDGAAWTRATSSAPWSYREGHGCEVYGNVIWVIGGTEYGNDAGSHRNDVWSSADGTTWVRATANAPWSYRSSHTSPVYDGKLWVIGGTEYWNDAGSHRNDVWYSVNGANWTRQTASAPWSYRSGHTSPVYSGKMWVIGGTEYGNDAGSHRNDVWFLDLCPTINSHPVSQTVCLGADVTLQVAATASSPLSYQWRMNGNPLAGETATILDLFDVTQADTGSYDVIVSNACGDVISNPASLVVLDGPDCNSSGVPDECEVFFNTSDDCNTNNVPDECDADCDSSGIPDECETDCNDNGIHDDCDLIGGTSTDCDANGVPDECQLGSGVNAWTGPSNGDFANPSYWDQSELPGVLSQAVIANTTPDDNRCVVSSEGTTTVCSLSIQASGSGRQYLRIGSDSMLSATFGTEVGIGGEIELAGGELAGGAVINAANTISGHGTISANILNNGAVRGETGRLLNFTGATFDNQITGNLIAPGSAVVRIQAIDVNQAGQIVAQMLSGIYFTAPVFNAAGGSIQLLGGGIGADNGLTNAVGGLVSGFGMIGANLSNAGDMVTIADTQVIGDLANNGTVTVQSGLLTVTGDLSGDGVIIGGFGGRGGDPCGGLVINGSYILGENATLRLGCGTLKLGGNFDVAINDYERFDMTIATLQMAGLSGTQLLETLADDAGTCATLPEPTLFSIGTLRIGPTPTTVKLVDAHVNTVGGSSGAEVLYVRQLTIETGARLDLGGKTLYYATSTPANPTTRVIDSVGGGRLIQLGGGGALRGDLNGDCKVDIADMPLFIQVLLGLDTTPNRVMAADMNASGQANGGDIQPFVGAILRP